MFTYPCLSYNNFYRMPNPISYMRILNSSPNSKPLDVYLNNNLVFRNLPYKKFSDYVSIPAGTYNIKIFPARTTSVPLFNSNIFIAPEKIWTTAIIDNYPNINILPIEDTIMPKIPHKALIRFINLSPDSNRLNLYLQNGNALFKNMPYKGQSPYRPLDPGTYTMYITESATGKKLLNIPNIRLIPNRFYSIYTVGNKTKPPKMQVLIPLDGNSYLPM
ncbi:hypothetical protein J2Z42_000697 [Clostridium algifaecis]|uniref:DUF4397 domain-containing protein n=1 Tax=Clostridium algifaecis TaxID=1472040 RepID=A0ABS4KPR7_9CLOT|nr:DUF4397 domain-containing protein [Clostridium algifaecis]MBP2032032.1 hypothetical protein [Clostridium algifaecis]